MTTFRYSLVLAAFLANGCNSEVQPNYWICESPPGFLQQGNSVAEQKAVTDQCILKWSYRLGRAQGPNSEIAEAVMIACRDAIDEFQNLILKEADGSLTEGQLDRLELSVEEFKSHALFRVIQGRAGNCSDRPEKSK